MTNRWAPHTAHDELVRAVAAHGLAGSVLALPEEPLEDRDFDELLASVGVQRLSGLLWSAVRDGAIPATSEQTERTEWHHVEALAGVLSLEQLLIEAAGSLAEAGIASRVLKGPALAHLDFPDPTLRTFGDVDLLVRGRDFDRATVALSGSGHHRVNPELRPGFDRRFSQGTSYRTDDGLELDLHRSFTMGPFGVRLAVDDLWRASESFWVGGHELLALPAEERFLHACYHAVLSEGSPRLVPLRDLAQLLLTRTLDVDRVHELARASRGAGVVARAVRHAWHAFDIADVLALSAWAQTYRSNERETADLALYDRGSQHAGGTMASVRALPRWRDRAAFVHAMVRPTRHEVTSRPSTSTRRSS